MPPVIRDLAYTALVLGLCGLALGGAVVFWPHKVTAAWSDKNFVLVVEKSD